MKHTSVIKKIKKIEGQCQVRRCKKPAVQYHCKSCNAVVCEEHQEPSGYGNHGPLTGDIKIMTNKKWRKVNGPVREKENNVQ